VVVVVGGVVAGAITAGDRGSVVVVVSGRVE